MNLTPEHLERLRVLAAKATPGTRCVGPTDELSIHQVSVLGSNEAVCQTKYHDAELIAALSPETVIELVSLAQWALAVKCPDCTNGADVTLYAAGDFSHGEADVDVCESCSGTGLKPDGGHSE